MLSRTPSCLSSSSSTPCSRSGISPAARCSRSCSRCAASRCRKLALPGLALRPADTFPGAVQFDLSLLLEESRGGGIDGWIEHSADLFDGATVERLALHGRPSARERRGGPRPPPVGSLPAERGGEGAAPGRVERHADGAPLDRSDPRAVPRSGGAHPRRDRGGRRRGGADLSGSRTGRPGWRGGWSGAACGRATGWASASSGRCRCSSPCWRSWSPAPLTYRSIRPIRRRGSRRCWKTRRPRL